MWRNAPNTATAMTTPELISRFVTKWGPGGEAHALNERQGAQQHFIELCAVLGVPAPTGGDYVFEKGTRRLGCCVHPT